MQEASAGVCWPARRCSKVLDPDAREKEGEGGVASCLTRGPLEGGLRIGEICESVLL